VNELDFNWLTGFECSYPNGVDELEKTQHYTHWGSDLLKVKSLGVKSLRYGVPWHRIHTAPGEFDWTWIDGPMQMMQDLGLTPIVDLVHFGTPRWLEGAFANDAYPAAAAEFALHFALRYPWVKYYTCVNEPSISAALCGELEHWYPRGRGERSYVRMLQNIARSVILMTWAVRDTTHGARFVWVDTCEYHHALDEANRERCDFLNQKRFLSHDLIWGRVNASHPLRAFLLEHGADPRALVWFEENGVQPDILGLDYYIQSEMSYEGEAAHISGHDVRLGMAGVARHYHARYDVPIMITETDAHDSIEARIRWLEETSAEMLGLRAEGVPVLGYCWWPAVDHIDWDTGLAEDNGHVNPVGLFALVREPDGRLSRVETALTERFRQIAAQGGLVAPGSFRGVGFESN
jgi:beta-glucosidase/6-phospho-beta-glucosidase/beta-galactosidase